VNIVPAILYGLVFITIKTEIGCLVSVVLIPCLLLVFRRLLTWWYHRKILRDETKLQQFLVRRLLLSCEDLQR
jgi:hypothetical protein